MNRSECSLPVYICVCLVAMLSTKPPFLSQEKEELWPLKDPSPIQLSIHDQMEMRGARPLPRQALLSPGYNERDWEERHRFTVCVCVSCLPVALGLSVCALWDL